MEKMFDSQELNVNPIVQEQDFPHPEGRLQKLMSQHRKDNNMPELTETQEEDQMKNVQVVHEFRTRKFEELKHEEQQKVLARIDGEHDTIKHNIDYIDDMVTKVNETSKEASKKYVESMKKMQEIQNKNYALMTKNIGAEQQILKLISQISKKGQREYKCIISGL